MYVQRSYKMFLMLSFCYSTTLKRNIKEKKFLLFSVVKINVSYIIVINMNFVLQSILIYQISELYRG